jgi:hypothetical protein
MSEAIIKSRWQFKEQSSRVPKLLAALQIEYREVAGQSFWEANKIHLPQLYREFQTEARSKMRELHPDTGGAASEFDAFVQALNNAKKQFAFHGVNSTPPSMNGVLTIPRGNTYRGQRSNGGFRNPSETLDVIRIIRTGLS